MSSWFTVLSTLVFIAIPTLTITVTAIKNRKREVCYAGQTKRRRKTCEKGLPRPGERQRVVITRTVDTHRVLDIIRNADRGIRILRANLLIRFKSEEVVPLLDEYQKAAENLHLAAAKICPKAGVPYRAPRGFETPCLLWETARRPKRRKRRR